MGFRGLLAPRTAPADKNKWDNFSEQLEQNTQVHRAGKMPDMKAFSNLSASVILQLGNLTQSH